MPSSIANRVRKLFFYLKEPRKVLQHLGAQGAYALKLTRTPVLPPCIDIEPNNTCNLRCRHCQVTYWKKLSFYLDEKGFCKILDQLPSLRSVKLQGMGEPLLNRQLPEMLRAGAERKMSMSFVTNGTVFTDSLAAQLQEITRLSIYFSVDGATAQTHESIRIGSNFDSIVKNIRDLTERRGAAGNPFIAITTVVTSQNLHEIPQLVLLAGELGVDSLSLQTTLTSWGKEEVNGHNRDISIPEKSEQLDKTLAEARIAAAANGVNLQVQYGDRYSRHRKCPWPWTRAFIAANGDVVPCCILADSDTIKMGNVFEESFATIWNSRGYQELRERIRKNDLYEFCKGCYGE